MKHKLLVFLVLLFMLVPMATLGADVGFAERKITLEPESFVDGTFFAIIEWTQQAVDIFIPSAQILATGLLTLEILIFAIMLASGLADSEREIVKKAFTGIVVSIVLVAWPVLYTGVKDVGMSLAALPLTLTQRQTQNTLEKNLKEMIRKNGDVRLALADQLQKEASMIGAGSFDGFQSTADSMLQQEQKDMEKLVEDQKNFKIFRAKPGYKYYLRPDALMRYVNFSVQPLYIYSTSRGMDIGAAIGSWFTWLICVICGIVLSVQYMLAMIELNIIGIVLPLFIAGACFSPLKFLSERVITTVVGHIVKVIVICLIGSLCLGLLFSMTYTKFEGTSTEMIRLLFTYLFFLFLFMQAPNLAAGMLTGAPSMGFGQVASAVNQMARTTMMVAHMAKTGGSAALKHGYSGAHRAAGLVGAVAGAWQGAQDNLLQVGPQPPSVLKSAGLQAVGETLKGSLDRAAGSKYTDMALSAISGSRKGSGLGAGGSNAPGGNLMGGDGLPDSKSQERYARGLNPESRYTDRLNAPKLGNYFENRKRESIDTQFKPIPRPLPDEKPDQGDSDAKGIR